MDTSPNNTELRSASTPKTKRVTIKREKQNTIKGLRELAHVSGKSDKLDAIFKNLINDKAHKMPQIPIRKKQPTDKAKLTRASVPKISNFIISPMEINYEIINNNDPNKAKRGGDAFLIKISAESDFKQLVKITRIANQMIWWDKIRHRNVIQCFNCQRIGHTARFCNRRYRCVKCDDNHGLGECKIEIKNNANEKMYCTNCKNYGHPASYRRCPV